MSISGDSQSSELEVPSVGYEAFIESNSIERVVELDPLGEDRFRIARLLPNISGAVFGGQLIANALTAAMLTSEGRAPHMMQAFFLRPGTLQGPLELEVERVRDGATMSHRRVELNQLGKLVLTADVSFHDGRAGPEHQVSPPPGVPAPESLEELSELMVRYGGRISDETRARATATRAWKIKPIDPPGLVERPREPRLGLWIKPTSPLSEDPLIQYAAVALLSDLWLAASARRVPVTSLFDKSASLVSLNHSLWFHQPASVNDWLLYLQESPVAGHGRGVGRGMLYDRSGRMVASAVQEALLL
jgi:acyl-CoA thioesterase-2